MVGLNRFFLYLVVGLWLKAFSCFNYAETQLDTIQTTANTLKGLAPYDFIGAHESLNSEQFDQNFNTLSSILEQQSGIEVQSIGGIGQYSSPVIRGSSGQQVLVFWDGMLINNLSGGSADIGNLNIGLAKKIDIYRSIAPAELTASAVGGLIHIQSADLPDTHKLNQGKSTLTYGSHNTKQVSLMQSFNFAQSQWLLATEYLSADNDFEYLQLGSAVNPNTPTLVPRYNNGVHQYHTLLKGLHKLNSGKLDISFQHGQNDRELSSVINSPTNQAKISTSNESFQLRWTEHWNSQYKSELISAISKQTQVYDDQFSSIGLGAQLNEYHTDGLKFNWNNYIDFNNVSALISARLQKESTASKYKLLDEEALKKQCSAGKGCNSEYQRLQADLSSRIKFLYENNQLILQASHIELADKNLVSTSSKNEYRGTTWSVGLEHQFSSSISPYLNIAEQIRLPSTNELFGDRGLTLGNPDLLAEQAQHLEIGLSFNNAFVEFQSSIYLRDIKNAIVAEPGNQGVIRYSNLGKTRHVGVESNLSWFPINQLSIATNLTLQDNKIIEDKRFAYYEGKQVAGYSQIYSFISLQWAQPNWDIKLSNTLELKGYYSNSNLQPKDNKNRWDASLGFNINEWRISLDGKDLTNNAVQDYPFYPEPGRSYFLRAQTKW